MLFTLTDHPPFTIIKPAIFKQITRLLTKAANHGLEIAEILSEASDTQVANIASYQGMPEDECWYFGFEFCQEWVPSFKHGFKAWVYTHDMVHYIFVNSQEPLIVRRIKQEIEKLQDPQYGLDAQETALLGKELP